MVVGLGSRVGHWGHLDLVLGFLLLVFKVFFFFFRKVWQVDLPDLLGSRVWRVDSPDPVGRLARYENSRVLNGYTRLRPEPD
jgi:hypothetical protein